jgi:hypothetical protein
MENKLQRTKKATHLEQAIFNFEGRSGWQVHRPEEWENLLSFFDEKAWRPDRKLVGDGTKTEHFSLAEHWMSYAGKSQNGAWGDFLNRMAKAYQELDKGVFMRATLNSLAAGYASRGRYEFTGTEETTRVWLQNYGHLWKKDEKLKIIFLARAVELDLFDLTNDLLKEGADPQRVLHISHSKAMFDVLLAAGAKANAPAGTDPRVDYENELPKNAQTTGWRNDRPFEYEAASSVYESMAARDVESYSSTADRDKILNLLARTTLKKKKGDTLSEGEVEARKAFVLTAITSAKKEKEVLAAIKASMPDFWEWKVTENGANVPYLFKLLERQKWSTVAEFIDRAPENLLVDALENGETALSLLMKTSDNQLLRLTRVENKVVDRVIDAIASDDAAESMEASAIRVLLSHQDTNEECPKLVALESSYTLETSQSAHVNPKALLSCERLAKEFRALGPEDQEKVALKVVKGLMSDEHEVSEMNRMFGGSSGENREVMNQWRTFIEKERLATGKTKAASIFKTLVMASNIAHLVEDCGGGFHTPESEKMKMRERVRVETERIVERGCRAVSGPDIDGRMLSLMVEHATSRNFELIFSEPVESYFDRVLTKKQLTLVLNRETAGREMGVQQKKPHSL